MYLNKNFFIRFFLPNADIHLYFNFLFVCLFVMALKPALSVCWSWSLFLIKNTMRTCKTTPNESRTPTFRFGQACSHFDLIEFGLIHAGVSSMSSYEAMPMWWSELSFTNSLPVENCRLADSFSETYGTTSHGSGWRTVVVNRCKEFAQNSLCTGHLAPTGHPTHPQAMLNTHRPS